MTAKQRVVLAAVRDAQHERDGDAVSAGRVADVCAAPWHGRLWGVAKGVLFVGVRTQASTGRVLDDSRSGCEHANAHGEVFKRRRCLRARMRRRHHMRRRRSAAARARRANGAPSPRQVRSWPELPRPGQPIELPVRAPPTLIAALGVRVSGLGWIALQHDPAGDSCVWCDDGATFHSGDAAVWETFSASRVMGPLLAPYDLGEPGRRGEHWLLCEPLFARLRVGMSDDVMALLRDQRPVSPRQFSTVLMGSERAAEAALKSSPRSVDQEPPIRAQHREMNVDLLEVWLKLQDRDNA